MIKWIIIFSILMGFIANTYALDYSTEEKSLIEQLENIHSNDTSRLSILYQLIKCSTSSDNEKKYIDQLLKTATDLNNNFYKCQAYLAYMYLGYNSFDPKEVNKWMNFLEPLARKEKYYDLLFLGKRCAVDMLIVSEEYEREEKEAFKMLEEAKKINNATGIAAASQSIANVYRTTYRNKEAAKLLEETYPTALKAGHNLSIEISNALITIYDALQDQPQKLKWIKKQDRDIQRLIKDSPYSKNSYKFWLVVTYINYLDHYTRQNDLETAKKYLKLTEENYFEGYSTVNTIYHQARYEYFLRSNQPENALKEIDAQFEINKKSPLLLLSNMVQKAKVLHKAGRYGEALSIYDQVFSMKDSMQIQHINKQLQQLKSDYNANQLLLERERIDWNTQLSLLIVIVIIIFLSIYIIIHTYRVRQKLDKSQKEMQKMSEDMEIANIAKENFLSTISSSIDMPLKEIVKEALTLSSNECLTKEQRTKISAELNENSGELMQLINNILDLSRLEAGMMKFQLEEVEMITLIRNLVRGITPNLPEIITILPNEEESLILSVDVSRISAVIRSLLSATDFSSVQDNRIRLEMAVTEDKRMILTVKGTYLAGKDHTQNQIITNEINRMLVEYFGGTYEIHSEDTPPYIRLTLSGKL